VVSSKMIHFGYVGWPITWRGLRLPIR